jgi:hypothetical protein
MSVDVSRTPQSPSTIRLTSTDMLHVVALFRLFAFAICHPGVSCFSSLPFPTRLFVSHMKLVGTAHNRLSTIRLLVPLEATTSLPVLLDAWLLKAFVARDKLQPSDLYLPLPDAAVRLRGSDTCQVGGDDGARGCILLLQPGKRDR